MYQGTAGCRQGRNNVLLVKKMREALQLSDNVMDNVARNLMEIAETYVDKFPEAVNLFEGAIATLQLRIVQNHPVHVEHDDVLGE
jgi:hypothetical protein